VHRLRSLVPLAAAAIVLPVAVACGGSDDDSSAEPAATEAETVRSTPTTTEMEPDAPEGLRLATVAGDLGDALYVTSAPGDPGRLYVVQQSGQVLILESGTPLAEPFVDVSDRIVSGGERGLLGLAFHPDYADNGLFYLNYTDTGGNTKVVEMERATTNSAGGEERVLLEIDQPFANHNGGEVIFGPDGFLYIGVGDGGSGGDPLGSGQDTDSLLGAILRIDVDSRTGGLPYGIPPSNPFANGGGAPEIFVYGARNPWRFSFDPTRGDLWIGDVGQDNLEEVDYLPAGEQAGANLGWNAFEGTAEFAGASATGGPSPATPPVYEYGRGEGCSITGGEVSRGDSVPAIDGRYLFSDFCSGTVWSMRAGPNPGDVRVEMDLGADLGQVTSFGRGTDGTIYVIAAGTLYRFAAS
jgi:glucose/arabinose dehydrogenase